MAVKTRKDSGDSSTTAGRGGLVLSVLRNRSTMVTVQSALWIGRRGHSCPEGYERLGKQRV